MPDEEASAEALAVFGDIRQTRNTRYVNYFWRAPVHDPALLPATWDRLKQVMGPVAAA